MPSSTSTTSSSSTSVIKKEGGMQQALNLPGIQHDGYKSRKFIFSVGVITLTSVLLMLAFVDSANWKDVIEMVTGAYMLGNVGERVTKTSMMNKKQDSAVTSEKEVTVTKDDPE
jgi:hypothetical protein